MADRPDGRADAAPGSQDDSARSSTSHVSRSASCIFCRIVAREAPSFRVDEDQHTLAMLDIFPVASGHTLVITKDHFENLFEASPEALESVVRMSKRVAAAIGASLSPDGLGVYQLNGAAAGQTVFHYHMHLVPRAMGEGLTLHGRKRAAQGELQEMAARLAAALPAREDRAMRGAERERSRGAGGEQDIR